MGSIMNLGNARKKKDLLLKIEKQLNMDSGEDEEIIIERVATLMGGEPDYYTLLMPWKPEQKSQIRLWLIINRAFESRINSQNFIEKIAKEPNERCTECGEYAVLWDERKRCNLGYCINCFFKFEGSFA